jgi:hypothetical protein
MARLLEDLRFFIGTFFLIIGVLLVIEGLRVGTLVEGYNLNLWTGIVFILFSSVALVLSVRKLLE